MKKGVSKPIYSIKKVEQKFNLKTLLGYEPSNEQKEVFFDLVVDKMQERTTSGKDINGNKFTKYSKDYAAKKGVSVGAVDLVLEGDMLESFEESSKQKNIIKVAVGSSEVKKSFNHNTGDTLPKRTYFGIVKDNEINKIIKQVNSLSSNESEETESTIDLAALRAAIQSVEVD